MSNKINLTGQVFGRLTVTGQAAHDELGRIQWAVRCTCGTEKLLLGQYLRQKVSRSCGCLHREELVARNLTHGHARQGDERSPTYLAWAAMLRRCKNKHGLDWKYYGSRGITVCDRWLNSFENFLVDMGEKPAGLEIDREDNEKGYYKENCRWATRKQNMRNMRSNRHITYQGRDVTIAEAAELCGLNYATLLYRIDHESGTDIFRPTKG